MRVRGTIAVIAFALLGCGGIAQSRSGDDLGAATVGPASAPDASGAGGSTAVDGSAAASEGGPTSYPDSGVCSMPVGSLAPGCPLALAPSCGPNEAELIGNSVCDLPFTPWVGSDATALSYVDVGYGVDMSSAGRLLRVADEAACSSTGNGWYFDDPVHPTLIHICPSACECGKAGPGSFMVLRGCWGNAAPGVLDAAIACPRCASARPKSCATPGQAFGYGIPTCEIPLDSAFDPAYTNVKYVEHGATAGPEEPWDGYLSYVPSLADCDKVEEGWTLDTSTSPPTVRICPSACSCLKVNNAMALVESGCPRTQAAGM